MSRNENSSNAIRAVLQARSLAVVGASNEPSKFGGMIMNTLIKGGYDGQLYPVNPKGGEIFARKAYKSLEEIPGSIDAVAIVVPARFVADLIRDAAKKGAKGAIILSAGFREFGRLDLEEDILEAARKNNIRLMGPNIQGITCLSNNMCAMFFPVLKQKGPVSVVTHSGSITAALADWAERDKLGITAAVNLGNQVDLCESDYLDYFANDPDTGVIACYLEGLKDGRRFLSALERASAKKPVAILKTGRSETGAEAAASHTGSLAGSHEVFTGVCRQFGAVSVESVVDLYDAVKGLALIRPPRGNRLAVLSSSGGAAALVADEAEENGFVMPPLPAEAIDELSQLGLTPMTHIGNPFDSPITVSAPYLQIARIIDKYDIADTILFSFADPVLNADQAFVEALDDLNASVATCFMGGGAEELKSTPEMIQAGMAVFPSPERAIHGIAAATWRASYLRDRSLDQEVNNVA